MLDFASKNLNLRILDNANDFNRIKESDYDIIVVGSDQIWRKPFMEGCFNKNYLYYAYLGFSNNWKINRTAYAPSIGVCGNDWEYNEEEASIIHEILQFYNGVSVREIQSEEDVRIRFKNNNVVHTLDPTLLLDKNDYIQLCKNIPQQQH